MGTKCHILILVVFTISCCQIVIGWQTSPSQYHIQTDEGPERYFRYQTDSGQYRKEKRLEDGTVIGTYAWIDDNGFLRQRDYIADNAGYRILKTKNVYVGRGVPVGEAVKAIKKVPAEAGTLVHHQPQRPVYSDLPLRRPVITDIPSSPSYIPPSSTYAPVIPTTDIYLPASVSSTTERPSAYKPAQSPYIQTNYLHSSTVGSTIESTTSSPIYSSTPSPIYASTPSPFNVEISPNAAPYSTPASISSTTPGYVEITQNSLISSSTEAPAYVIPIANNSGYSTPSSILEAPASVQFISQQPQQQDYSQNSLDYNPYVSQNDKSYVFHNGPTYPIDKRGQTYNGRLGNGYDPQYPAYDGVSVTNDGFRYYIPRAYHEEQTSGDRRDGSFGYIDPFGIRRVIYYNTAPGTGFQHRKNNRYVGFQATPYDPRPY